MNRGLHNFSYFHGGRNQETVGVTGAEPFRGDHVGDASVFKKRQVSCNGFTKDAKKLYERLFMVDF